MENYSETSNIIDSNLLRTIQEKTLEICSKAIEKSYGPKGSNTTLISQISNGKNNTPYGVTKYTKDGHTILENINFVGTIERCVKESIFDMTSSVALSVGDGTSTTVIMANIIFKKLVQFMKEHDDMNPSEAIEKFKVAVDDISKDILKRKKEFTLEDAKDICYISSNGDKKITDEIYSVYNKFGVDTKISLQTSPINDSFTKANNGITLKSSIADPSLINTKDGKCQIVNPRIYVFTDPIYNDELADIFSKILNENVFKWLEEANSKKDTTILRNVIPTVILTPEISVDLSTYMKKICQLQGSLPLDGKFPINIVTNIDRDDLLDDVCKLTGAVPIRRYISKKIMEIEKRTDLAITTDNLDKAYGTAKAVTSDPLNTIIVEPSKLYKDSTKTEFTDESKALINYLESKLESYKKAGKITSANRIKNRLHGILGNLVEYYVGGLSISDREQVKYTVEDCILSCRSAYENGVGRSCNVEGLLSSNKLQDKSCMHKIIFNAYRETIDKLFIISGIPEKTRKEIIEKIIKNGVPYDIRRNEYNYRVKGSIMSDVKVLEALSKILTLMVTTNQLILPNPLSNEYKNL